MFNKHYFDFSTDKNAILQKERGISFEQIIVLMESENIISVKPHHNQIKYKNQYIAEVFTKDYIYLVPFVIEGRKIFLKTIYPSRKAVKNYKKGDENA